MKLSVNLGENEKFVDLGEKSALNYPIAHETCRSTFSSYHPSERKYAEKLDAAFQKRKYIAAIRFFLISPSSIILSPLGDRGESQMEASYTTPDGNPAWGCADNSMNPETASGFCLEF